MMETASWEYLARLELEKAEEARQNGNEGMARVCARRAAGAIAGEYLRQFATEELDRSAYNRLRILVIRPELSDECRLAAERLLMRVTTEHNLPVEADLISDACFLASELLSVDLR